MGKVATGSLPRIDFGGIAGRSSLRAEIINRLGPPGGAHGRPCWRCPWHKDESPSMYLYEGGKRWRCWPCGLTGDVLDFIVRYDRVDLAEAAKKLDPSITIAQKSVVFVSSKQNPEPPVVPPPPAREEKGSAKAADHPWKDPRWQEEADGIIRHAEKVLWSSQGSDALEWLRRRGLEDHVIRFHRLGFLPEWANSPPIPSLGLDDNGRPKRITAARGIVIPLLGPESCFPTSTHVELRWSGANVRRLNPDVFEPWEREDKCLTFTGSRRGYAYPYCDLTPGVPVLITEGEIDALLAHQFVGHMVNVLTTGGATISPRPEAVAELSTCPHWLIATDQDDAGDKASTTWRSRSPEKARRLVLPHGKDIGDSVQAGGDLRAWLESELIRLGIEP